MSAAKISVSILVPLLLAACSSDRLTRSSPQPVAVRAPVAAQADNKVWARIDGQRMSGNPALLKRGQTDLAECRVQSAASPGAQVYDLAALSECMGRRGYKEISANG